jgi:hypothetical protein
MKRHEGGGSDQKRKRWRNPEYPSIGLRTAVQLARKIWEKEKRNQMSVEVGFKHMGFASRSGPTLRAVAALKKFGLLVQPSLGRVQLSDEGVQVIVRPTEDALRLEVLQRMAQRPEIFRELLRRFTDGLPSDQNLRTELVAGLHFSDEAAATLIAVLKETMEFVALREPQAEQRAPAVGDHPRGLSEGPDKGSDSEFPAHSLRDREPASHRTASDMMLQIATRRRGCVAEFRTNRPLTAAQYELVRQFLALAEEAEESG